MSKIDNLRPSGCPIAYALDLIGDRWSLLIIRDIMLRENKTYGGLLQADEGIASNILVDRLKKLTAAGILDKTRDPDNRRSFLYELTDKGRDLAPVLIEMVLWSGKHDTRPEARKDVFQRAIDNKAALDAAMRSAS